MRCCKNCGKVNTDWPSRCRHCGAGLEGRLCSRGHANPLDPQLSFCGECGQPLERKSGAGFSATPYLVALAVAMLTFLFSGSVLFLFKEDPPMAALLAIVILIFGLRLVFQILPPGVRTFMREAANLLLRLVFGTGNKG
jgi:double zinc ribbon protein